MINLIIGAPRSGTTFLWTLLVNSNQVFPITRESLDQMKKLDKYETSESGCFYISQYYSRLDKLIEARKDSILIEKTPMHTLCYHEIPKKYIKNTIVLLRNPIYIVQSMFFSTTPEVFLKYDLNYSIAEVKKYYAKLIEISKNADCILFYEDLINDISNLKPLLSLLKIRDYNIVDKEIISFAKRQNSHTLDESQSSFVKSKLEKEFAFWKNTKDDS